MIDNPFQTPQHSPDPLETQPGPGPNPLLVPAVFLMILSTLFLGYLAFYFVVLIGMPPMFRDSSMDDIAWVTSSVIVPGVSTAINAAVVLGAIGMLRLKNYSAARLGAICAVIPLCGPCFVLGIPFGIWALVLMRSPEIQASFR